MGQLKVSLDGIYWKSNFVWINLFKIVFYFNSMIYTNEIGIKNGTLCAIFILKHIKSVDVFSVHHEFHAVIQYLLV